MKFVVRCNTHLYYDCSDTPRSTRVIVSASNREEARQIVCAKRNRDEKHGNRYIGLVFDAEVYFTPPPAGRR